jgi:hypothetical protein
MIATSHFWDCAHLKSPGAGRSRPFAVVDRSESPAMPQEQSTSPLLKAHEIVSQSVTDSLLVIRADPASNGHRFRFASHQASASL